MRITKLAALGLVGALALTACGDDGESSEGTTDEAAEGSGSGETVRLWLNGEDVPEDVVAFLEEEFESTHEGVDLVFERQQWDGIVERLTTALVE